MLVIHKRIRIYIFIISTSSSSLLETSINGKEIIGSKCTSASLLSSSLS